MPNVIRFNSRSTDKYCGLAKAIGKSSAEELAQAIEHLRKSLDVEDSLQQYGIKQNIWQENLDTITQNAMNDPCTGTNPRKPTAEEIRRIFECCYEGSRVDF